MLTMVYHALTLGQPLPQTILHRLTLLLAGPHVVSVVVF